MSLRDELNSQIKKAMIAKDKMRLNALRLLLAEIKKIEVDEQITVDDTRFVAVVTKMVKQREDSAAQYTNAGRPELAEGETFEASVLQEFLPPALSDEEVDAFIAKAIADTNAQAMSDMSKVMSALKPELQGRTDMGKLSKKVKDALSK
jgi:uncharacterized protein YqeY